MKGTHGLAYALLLLAIVACTCPQSNSNKPSGNGNSSPSASPSATAEVNKVTMASFNQLKTGMTYDEVVKILGKEGKELSSSEIGGTKTVMYQWDGEGGIGANMNAMFQNGKMISKSQFGLK